ncbi:hypothetical protein EHI8A_048530 [Entamoeba histolytica HM-1:IMSS-B]|uniref:Uncharacterized protein n=6 Tax=Entamoeba histolytica TaxID=5759 RepID=C4M221_ENTH1|nr:hypothetical protein EHI_150400 [Entamoeba histolytica HM-1:IMSS]EMD46123.1 Hypothetical protein EHI5A_079450 [Entamoeba histolytica KU27]EMH73897.1 hypothetical protein EHI8A_048530 [Entamoeba histolytica HM-1:IMSS-B]EMS15390.1 hypothetical protein KM1_096230 [Entamoeba histolytica HM-3:IMSS]ENY62859.1 hypothetical protein EHI7A_048940 [Entamoeba histolytica HM-1:IMSS-A]GAT95301.1 hypothetical protein CL6EHI_150400 [Entamoeba histolytica]|eukprot:XP_655825.1 hypothetical protein EHI_150400 [Entamoeba histolytica HM-1:IMSS]
MIGKHSSDYYEYDEGYSDEELTDKNEVVLFGLWGIFLFLIIPSIIVFSVFYPSLKYPLDSLSDTIRNNKTFIKTVENANENNAGGKYLCDKECFTSVIGIQKELSLKNIVLLKAHELITGNERARSNAGTFNINIDSHCRQPTVPESYLITGYETMGDGGVFLIGVNYNIPENGSSLMSDLINVDDRFNIFQWRNGTRLISVSHDINQNDTFIVESNIQGQPFVQINKKYCYSLRSQLTNQSYQNCSSRIWLEDTFRTVDGKKQKPYIWMTFNEYQLISNADTNIKALSCHLIEPNKQTQDQKQHEVYNFQL